VYSHPQKRQSQGKLERARKADAASRIGAGVIGHIRAVGESDNRSFPQIRPLYERLLNAIFPPRR